MTLFLFLIRAFSTGAFQVAYVYTPEVYPTEIRASALGFFSSTARIGAIITPYVAQVNYMNVKICTYKTKKLQLIGAYLYIDQLNRLRVCMCCMFAEYEHGPSIYLF